MSTEEFWKGDFGNQYHTRNRVDWRERIPFWHRVMDLTGARSVYELGCGPGWNLSAILAADPRAKVYGADLSAKAVNQARFAGLSVEFPNESSPPSEMFDLVCTVGMLIHVAPEDLGKTMRDLIRMSARYVLAVEYAADKEEEIDYRGHAGKLWRRPFGKLYEDLGLKPVRSWPAGAGFDNCTAWLMERA